MLQDFADTSKSQPRGYPGTSRVIPSIATLIAAVAASWTGIVGLVKGTPADYDSVVALTALTVVGLVWYTYFTRETLEHARWADAERRRQIAESIGLKRAGLATAVLAELFSLTGRLKNVHAQGPTNFGPDLFSHPMLEHAAMAPHLFQHDTIADLAATLRYVRDVQNQLGILPGLRADAKAAHATPAERQAAEDRRVETQEGIRIRAGWAFNRAVALQQRLTAEGGSMPSGSREKSASLFERQLLLPDPFTREIDDS